MKRVALILTLILLTIFISSCMNQDTGTTQTPTQDSTSDSKDTKQDSESVVKTSDIISKSPYGPDYGQECGYVKDTEKKLCRCVGDSEIGKDGKVYCKGTCDTLSCKCYKGRDEVPCLQ